MAFFDERELVDLIRHELRVEDDSGFTARIIQPPNRRGKYGGLPLNFRHCTTEEQEDDKFSEQQFKMLEAEPRGSRHIIESRMRSRTVESDKTHRITSNNHILDDLSTLFAVPHTPVILEPKESLLSKLIDQNTEKFKNPLNEFGRFEAEPDSRNSQTINVCFPHQDGSESLKIKVSVIPSAMVFEVIGLCCLKYFQATSKELPGDVEEYCLYMADEDTGEMDPDFPPLEKSRAISNLAFPILAVARPNVSNDSDSQSRSGRKIWVTVFFTSGEQYGIEIPSASTTVAWLKDEALKRWRSSRPDELELLPDAPYIVESLEQEGKMFADDTYISTCGCTDFVVYRKNSSRHDFNPRKPPCLFSQTSIASPISPTLTPNRRSLVFDFVVPDGPSSPMSMSFDSTDDVISCFVVIRLHRYKPRWTAKLVIRWTSFEIVPFASEMDRKKSFLPQQYQKITKVPWEHICDVQFSEKEKPKISKETIYSLTFTFFVSDKKFSVADFSLEIITEISEAVDRSGWKSVQVECKSREDAMDIYDQVQSIINQRESPIFKLWNISHNGILTPHEAAKKYLLTQDDEDPQQLHRPVKEKKIFNHAKVASLAWILRLGKHK